MSELITESAELVCTSTWRQREIGVYVEPDDLPCDLRKRTICEAHLTPLLRLELMKQFWGKNCADETADDGYVSVQFSCAGSSGVFIRHCPIELIQHDLEGNELNKIR